MQLAANVVARAWCDDHLSAIAAIGGERLVGEFPRPVDRGDPGDRQSGGPGRHDHHFRRGPAFRERARPGSAARAVIAPTGDPGWLNTIAGRGHNGALANPPTSFGPGAGRSSSTRRPTHWFFGDSNAGLTSNKTDLFTVAEHEIGHILGLGTSGSWFTHVSGMSFNGARGGGGVRRPRPSRPRSRPLGGQDAVRRRQRGDGPGALQGEPVDVHRPRLRGARGCRLGRHAAEPEFGRAVQRGHLRCLERRRDRDDHRHAERRTGVLHGRSMPLANGPRSPVSITSRLPGRSAWASARRARRSRIPILNAGDTGRRGRDDHSQQPSSIASCSGITRSPRLTISEHRGEAAAPKTSTATVAPIPALSTSATRNGRCRPQATGRGPRAIDLRRREPGRHPRPRRLRARRARQTAVFRPSTGQWFIAGGRSSLRLRRREPATISPSPPITSASATPNRPSSDPRRPSGSSPAAPSRSTSCATNLTDIPVPGDYDGNGRARAGGLPSLDRRMVHFGHPEPIRFGAANLFDIPVPGDYDGLGHTELAVFRPQRASGSWPATRSRSPSWADNFRQSLWKPPSAAC